MTRKELNKSKMKQKDLKTITPPLIAPALTQAKNARQRKAASETLFAIFPQNVRQTLNHPIGVTACQSSIRIERVGILELDQVDEDFYRQLFQWLQSEEAIQKMSLEQVQNLWRKEIINRFQESPNELKHRLDESDRAFTSIFIQIQNIKSSLESAAFIDWVKNGRELLQQRECRQALECFQKAMMASSSPPIDTIILAGTAALHCKEFGEAEVYVEHALAKDSSNIKAVMLKGLLHYTRKEFELAIQVFERALTLRPDSAPIKKYLKLSQSYLNSDPISRNSKPFVSMTNIIDPSERREWIRTECQLEITVNNFEQMTTRTATVSSISGGGCLLSDYDPPEEFHFSLDVGDNKTVHGYAKKAYLTGGNSAGVKFLSISLNDQEIINTKVLSGAFANLLERKP